MLKTSTNQYKKNIEAYILECLDCSIIEAFERYESEFNNEYNKRRYPNQQERFAEYLMGLPFGFDFNNYDILTAVVKLHELESVDQILEKTQNTILKNWWNHLAFHIIRLKK